MKILFPCVILKYPTCKITDSTSMRYTSPTITINNGIRSISAVDATNPPSASDPVSPINTLAGYVLNIKKPNRAPITDVMIGDIFALIPRAAMAKKVATITVTPDARPSRPSVKFTPLTVPRTTINIKITNSHAGIENAYPSTNGIRVWVSSFATSK